jgi:uncharacterized membrane protein HdeD (DUF308 family)
MTEIPAMSAADVPGQDPSWRARLTSEQVVVRESALFPWWSLLVLGVLTLLLGIVVLAWPGSTLRVLGVLAGIWMLVAGVIRIVSAFVRGRGVGRQVLSGIVGVVLVLGGLACLRDIATSLVALALIVSLSWMLSGIAEIVMAADARGSSRTWLLVLGVLSAILGLIFLFFPGLSLFALVLTTGLGFITTGAVQVVLAITLRRAH